MNLVLKYKVDSIVFNDKSKVSFTQFKHRSLDMFGKSSTQVRTNHGIQLCLDQVMGGKSKYFKPFWKVFSVQQNL
jgi:hypothetical protein